MAGCVKVKMTKRRAVAETLRGNLHVQTVCVPKKTLVYIKRVLSDGDILETVDPGKIVFRRSVRINHEFILNMFLYNGDERTKCPYLYLEVCRDDSEVEYTICYKTITSLDEDIIIDNEDILTVFKRVLVRLKGKD